ncbi:LPS assembly lipoprotein LptE [Pontibaca methylaminivorans]|uniref:LPS assembly lipoprotein LptE n=1 Tax=Pontibaca methylaminivorans TaxID=515897 RepID=UPI002FD8CBDA
MSWFERRAVLLMPLALALAACGFTPVYGPDGSGSALRGRVAIDAPATENGYRLVENLEDRLGRAISPEYELSLEVESHEEGQAIKRSGDITRYSVVGDVDYALRRLSDNALVASGSVTNFASYSATGLEREVRDDSGQILGQLNATTVQTLAAERDAHERLMVMLADQIMARLLATADLGQ